MNQRPAPNDEHTLDVTPALLETRRGRRPGVEWTPVARGLHRRGGDGFLDDLRAWQPVMRPAASFAHLTAARAWGWWLPPLPAELPVWIMQCKLQNPSTRDGLVVIRRRGTPTSDVLDGVPVTTPAETLVTCARDLGLLDLLVLTDSALHSGDVSFAELRTVAAQHRRGAPLLREAIPLADGRSESPFETLLRLLHVVCDVPVVPQKELYAADGSFVARGDLWLVGTTRFHEHDGADHLERRRLRKDLKRSGRIDRADHQRRGYVSDDVLTQGVTILRDADEAIGRPHDPARIRPWHALLRQSLFTPAGTARFCRRVGLPVSAPIDS